MRWSRRGTRATPAPHAAVHKCAPPPAPRLSIVLLDWSCRERFTALDWLARQSVPRDQYELIWIELFDRIEPEVMAKADVVLTLGQKGMYHKHVAYNVGVLQARGELLTVCDSDAVFPPDFVASVLRGFAAEGRQSAVPKVLMHHERRTSFRYPPGLSDTRELADSKWQWWTLVPNAGACMSVRREDALRFGGFDEHRSFRGYLCGPYELGWRLVNAGIPEVWHDTSVTLWHFAHPDPVNVNGLGVSWRRARESRYPHVDMHALRAVEAFSTGRLLPLRENPAIWAQRMRAREIGTAFEEKYANMTGRAGFARRQVAILRAALIFGQLVMLAGPARRVLKKGLAHAIQRVAGLAALQHVRVLPGRLRFWLLGVAARAKPLETRADHEIVFFRGSFYGVPRSLGWVDFSSAGERGQVGIVKDTRYRRLMRHCGYLELPRAPRR